MGYYATSACPAVSDRRLDISRLGFLSRSRSRSARFTSKPQELRCKTELTGAKTRIGVPTGRPILSTKYLDQETGLYYYGYRFYNPSLGRWPSRDPVGEDGGINLYACLQNNLLCRIDELGLADSPACCCCCAEKNVPTIVRSDIILRGGFNFLGHLVKFSVTLAYLKDSNVKGDCSFTWAELSNLPIPNQNLPGDGQWHDLPPTSASTSAWGTRKKPCGGSESFGFLDLPHVSWGEGTTPSIPLKWTHKIKVEIISTPGCKCHCSKIIAEVDRYTEWNGGNTAILKAGTMMICIP